MQQQSQKLWRVELSPAGLEARTNTQHVGPVQNEPIQLPPAGSRLAVVGDAAADVAAELINSSTKCDCSQSCGEWLKLARLLCFMVHICGLRWVLGCSLCSTMKRDFCGVVKRACCRSCQSLMV